MIKCASIIYGGVVDDKEWMLTPKLHYIEYMPIN